MSIDLFLFMYVTACSVAYSYTENCVCDQCQVAGEGSISFSFKCSDTCSYMYLS